MTTRAILIEEPKSGLSVKAVLLDAKAPDNASFLWDYLAETRIVGGIHAMWTGPEISCPIPPAHLEGAGYAMPLPASQPIGNSNRAPAP